MVSRNASLSGRDTGHRGQRFGRAQPVVAVPVTLAVPMTCPSSAPAGDTNLMSCDN
jgi:hypothetical protein